MGIDARDAILRILGGQTQQNDQQNQQGLQNLLSIIGGTGQQLQRQQESEAERAFRAQQAKAQLDAQGKHQQDIIGQRVLDRQTQQDQFKETTSGIGAQAEVYQRIAKIAETNPALAAQMRKAADAKFGQASGPRRAGSGRGAPKMLGPPVVGGAVLDATAPTPAPPPAGPSTASPPPVIRSGVPATPPPPAAGSPPSRPTELPPINVPAPGPRPEPTLKTAEKIRPPSPSKGQVNTFTKLTSHPDVVTPELNEQGLSDPSKLRNPDLRIFQRAAESLRASGAVDKMASDGFCAATLAE